MTRVGVGVAVLRWWWIHGYGVDEPEAAIESHHHDALGVALGHGLGAVGELIVVQDVCCFLEVRWKGRELAQVVREREREKMTKQKT